VTLSEADTDALLSLVQKGNRDAVRILLDRHRDRLKRMVSLRLDNRMASRIDPSDIVQEALAEAAMKIDEFAHDRPVAFYVWLRQMTWRHLVIAWRQHVKAERRSVTRELELDLSDDSRAEMAGQFVDPYLSPGAEAIRNELQSRVQHALEQLRPHDRELLVLRYLEQLSLREIGEVLGISESAARKRHVRALQRLQRFLSPEDAEP
jgi:RNA polymerase sigma-70 factor (ECF subfamily)